MAYMYNQVVLEKIDRYFVIKNAIKYLTHSYTYHVAKAKPLLEQQLAHAQSHGAPILTFSVGVVSEYLAG
jgi:hypothetical protein